MYYLHTHTVVLCSAMSSDQCYYVCMGDETYDLARLRQRFDPYVNYDLYAWDLATIRAARDAQCRGDFRTSARLAEAVKTDASIYTALLNRIAPHRGLPRQIIAPRASLQWEAEATFGPEGPALPPQALADMFERSAMLGVSISQLVWRNRPDGTRCDVRLEPWPMSSVWWDGLAGAYRAHTTSGIITIQHGDGKWVIAAHHGEEPWQWGAVKALGLVWADRAFAIRDRSQNSEAHGQAKFLGKLPADIPYDSDEGLEFAALVQGLRGARSGGLIPAGSEVQLKESMSQAWQIFREIISGDGTDIAGVLLGQDGTVKNEGGNYIKAAQLFGIRNDIVEADLSVHSSAIHTGMMRPWAAVNLGDADLAPTISWPFPDPDEDARRREIAERHEAFNRAVMAYQASGFEVDQPFVDRLAAEYGVEAPRLRSPADIRPPTGDPQTPDSPPPAP